MSLSSDVRLAVRLWRRTPGVTLIALLSGTLSVAAVSTVFTAVRTVLLAPLPYSDPQALVQVRTDVRHARASVGDWIFGDNALAIMRRTRTLQSAGVWGNAVFDLAGDSATPPEAVYGIRITSGLLPTLGVSPMLGRGILPEDEHPANPVVILSYGLWIRRFLGDRRIIGRNIAIDGHSCQIIGVMPAAFDFPLHRAANHTPQPYVEFYAPLDLQTANPHGGLGMVARLRPGISLSQAEQDLDSISTALAREFPAENRDRVLRLGSLRDRTIGNSGPMLWLAFGATAMFLLIGCANLGTLLLARNLERQREITIRVALGASRSRIVRQLVTESCTLAVVSGAAAFGLAAAAWRALPALVPAAIPRLAQSRVDWRIFLFALLSSTVSNLLFSLAPALRAARGGELGARGASSMRRDSMRTVLVTVEVAVMLVLVAAGGRFLGGFLRLLRTDPGFSADRVLAAVIPTPAARYPSPDDRLTLHQRLAQALQAIPGVESFGTSDALPFSGENHGGFVAATPASVMNTGRQLVAEVDLIGGQYLQTLGTHLEAGRWFRQEEEYNATSDTAIVDLVAARRLWPGQSALGKRICVSCTPEKPDNWKQVVGVVSNIRHADLNGETQPNVYLPGRGWVFWVLRTGRPEGEMEQAVRRAVAAVDPQQPVLFSASMHTLIADSLSSRRFLVLMLSVTALLALALAAAGVYGVTSFTTARRTPEIGIRMALGATPGNVHALIFRQEMVAVGAGIALGSAMAFALERISGSFPLGLDAGGTAYLWIAAGLATLTAMLACWLPARRATSVEPMSALRAE